MKNTVKGIKLEVKSPNESLNIQFDMDEITFEANLQEMAEIMKGTRDLVRDLEATANRTLEKSHAQKMEYLRTKHELEVEKIELMNKLKGANK